MSGVYGCHGRPSFKPYRAQEGWVVRDGMQVGIAVTVKPFGQKDCQFTLSVLGNTDKRCTGCIHKKETT